MELFERSPHARGDGPRYAVNQVEYDLGSPHARGDGPSPTTTGGVSVWVVPTHVGMARWRLSGQRVLS